MLHCMAPAAGHRAAGDSQPRRPRQGVSQVSVASTVRVRSSAMVQGRAKQGARSRQGNEYDKASCCCHRAGAALQATLKGHAAVAKSWLQPYAGGGASSTKLPPQAVVHVATSLDSCYYALLEHFLTCEWAAPAVPPPHDYFPAITASHHGESGLLERTAYPVTCTF